MGKLILVTGGARSGKSSYAEKLAAGEGQDVLYVATAVPFDDEMKLRVEKHKAGRPGQWQTIEVYKDLFKTIKMHCKDKQAVLLDCITVMITNIMMEYSLDWKDITSEQQSKIEKLIETEINGFIKIAESERPLLIAVTNEVGLGLVPEYPLSRAFRDIAGRMNQKLSGAADEVYMCVCGIPVRIK